MKKHLLVTLLLSLAVPCASFNALAAPEPQNQSQAAAIINGTVFDENGLPIIGASIVQKGNTSNAVTTDVDGHFRIRVAEGTPLLISYIGYKAVDIAAKNGMTVKLDLDNELLDEVVIVGYGSQKRANLTGAVSTVDVAQVMESRPQQDVMKALQGAVPGLTILNNNGNIDGTPSITIRGTGTLTTGKSEPLIVVDGVPMDDISYLDPNDIKEISVLKDAASSSIYGTRAAFGVILITTKGGAPREKMQIKYSNNFAWSQATVLPEMTDNVTQLKGMIQAAKQTGPTEGEFFGQYYTDMLPYAEAWQRQNSGKITSYGVLRPYESMDNVGDYYLSPDGKTLLSYADYDVNKIFINNAAPSQSHNVGIDGTTGKAVYNVSFAYASRESLVKFNPDRVRRYNAKADLQLNLYDWLTAGVRFSYVQRHVKTVNFGSNTYGTIWRFPGFYQMLGQVPYEGELYDWRNQIAYQKQAAPINNVNTFTRMQAWVRAQPIKGLTLNADFTYMRFNRNSSYAYLPVYGFDNWFGPVNKPSYFVTQASTTATKTNAYNDRWTMNVYGSYDFTVARDHNFKVMLGSNVERNIYSSFDARIKVLLDNNLPALNLTGGDVVRPNSSDTHWATAGFFGRINYDYKGIYLLELNGRYDGSSRFPANDQWAFFTSVSGAYRFSEEAYFKPLKKIVSNGKLRASYGEIGNQAIGDNQFLSTINIGNLNWLNTATGLLMQGAGAPKVVSPSLTWERICTTNVGIDLGLLRNEITASFDWYQRENKNMLSPGVTLPDVFGANAPLQNAGSLRTRGWELAIGWNHTFGDFNVFASFNISDQKTTITKWNNPTYLINNNYSGLEYGTIWGFETDRYYTEDDFVRNSDGSFAKDERGSFIPKDGVVDQRGIETGNFHFGPGDIMFKDQDNDKKISGGKGTVGDHGDIVKIGNNLPRYEYGFHLGGNWKGIDLDIFCQGVGKRDYWTVSSMVIPFTQAPNDILYSHMTSHNTVNFDSDWNIIGYNVDQANRYANLYPGSFGAGNVNGLANGCYNYYPQTRYLQDLSYLRVKNITVGYTLPRDLTSKAYIEKLRVYFSGDNLFFIHRGNKDTSCIDPEITTTEWSGLNTWGRTNPIQRTYSFGIQVTF